MPALRISYSSGLGQFVAQIFNLPYRRFGIGRASVEPNASDCVDAPQNAIPRYCRLKICATSDAIHILLKDLRCTAACAPLCPRTPSASSGRVIRRYPVIDGPRFWNRS